MNGFGNASAISLMVAFLTACSGGGGTVTETPTPVASPSPTPTPVADPWASVQADIDAFEIENVTILIGDERGVQFSFERGNVNPDTPLTIASASKLLSGLTFTTLIEDNLLSYETGPADVLDYWVADDLRSAVNVRQLLSFTSGFNARPTDIGCWALGGITLQQCAERIYENGQDTDPGSAFSYGPEHMQVAGAMVETLTDLTFAEIFRQQIGDPLNLTPQSQYNITSTENPWVSGGATSTASDYAIVLQSLLAGELIADIDGFLEDNTTDVEFLHRPTGLDDAVQDWHYGSGFWIECDLVPFDETCLEGRTISSAGAFGFVPWVDFGNGYFGIIAVEERDVSGVTGMSVTLAQQLQEIIPVALENAG